MLAYNRAQNGFTLVELIMGLVVLSIVLALVTTLIGPQARRSIDPIMQVRATELAQSILNEMSARSFDELSDRTNGVIRCNDDFNPANGSLNDPQENPCSAILGAEAGESREDFDDIDDYIVNNQSGGDILNSLGEQIIVDGENIYAGFSIGIAVTYDGNYDGVSDNLQNAKLITVVVTTPSGDTLPFSTYRSNF